MAIIVQKFGGSSVANAERIFRVAKRVGETYDAGNQVVVVVSAMGDTTDDLIALASQITSNPSAREMDMLLSTGEQQSISLLAMALMEMGYSVASLTGWQAGYHTDGVYSRSRIQYIEPSRVLREIGHGNIVVVAGFQGISQDGDITTLGRGGSDTSAVAMAIALKADVCEIFTDVDGVYTADPRIVKSAWKMPEISYDEMLEMAAMGAVVLQPRSVELAKQYNLTLHVRSSFNYNEGTIVKEVATMNKDMEKEMVVCGVAHDTNVVKASIFGVPDIPGAASEIFNKLARSGINVDMIVQSGTRDSKQDMSFTAVRSDRKKIEAVLSDVVENMPAESYALDDTVAKVSVVGAGMISRPGVAAKVFQVLSKNNINILLISTSEIKISCIVDELETKKAVRALHTAFELDADTLVNVEA